MIIRVVQDNALDILLIQRDDGVWMVGQDGQAQEEYIQCSKLYEAMLVATNIIEEE